MKRGLSLRDDRAARKPCLDIYAGGSLRHPDLLLYPPVVSDVSFDLGHHLYPLVISPIREKSRVLAFSRIKANFLGAFIGFCITIICKPTFLVFCLGAITIIIICNSIGILEMARSALLFVDFRSHSALF